MSKRADSTPPFTNRTRVRRLSERGAYDRPAIDAILDEALVCHVGFVCEGQPYVIPTIHVRHEDRIIIHGSPASRMLRALVGGAPACITVTLLDGLVLARSAFHHSMNYRSVVILGRAREVTDPDEKRTAFRALVEHVIPGRWGDAREPSPSETAGTTVLAFGLDECSAKVRTGPPVDDEEDYGMPIWAGVLPLVLSPRPPVDDPRLSPGIVTPDYVAVYRRPGAE